MDKCGRWFDEGAAKLRMVLAKQGRDGELPSADPYYACPCCLRVYPRVAVTAKVLTIEHVPPEALGGLPMLLTCADCNSSSGTKFDSHATQKAVADAFVRGETVNRRVRATSYIDGIPLRGYAQSTEDGISLVGIPKQNNPRELAAFLEALGSLADQENASSRFSFTIHTRYDEARARLSLIRAAYLAAFAGLGWSYILDPVMQPVRNQLNNPESRALETYIFRDPNSSSSVQRLLIVNNPDELRCVAVIIGEYSVFLPGLCQPMTWDETAAAFCRRREADDRLSVTLHGKEVPWPKEPTYFLD